MRYQPHIQRTHDTGEAGSTDGIGNEEPLGFPDIRNFLNPILNH